MRIKTSRSLVGSVGYVLVGEANRGYIINLGLVHQYQIPLSRRRVNVNYVNRFGTTFSAVAYIDESGRPAIWLVTVTTTSLHHALLKSRKKLL